MANIQAFKNACIGVPLILPSSSEYPAARKIYQGECNAVPLAIVQPETRAQVQQIICAAAQNGIKVTIRSGGHNIPGLCIQDNSVTIDMRRIRHVGIAPDKNSATIGGGATNLDVARALEAEGLVTPLGLVATVGFIGWSTFGGYGSFMNHFGLGKDNILGAEIVNAEGEVIQADNEMLRAIRGAGGALGVIVSLRVKVYPLTKVLAGSLLLDVCNFKPFILAMEENAFSFPPALQIGTAIFNLPNGKRNFRVELLWSSPNVEEGRKAIEYLKSIAPPVIDSHLQETALSSLITAIDEMIPPNIYGHNETVSIPRLDNEILDLVNDFLDQMPKDPATVLALHHLSPVSPSSRDGGVLNSSFPIRFGHTMIEFIGSVVHREDRPTSEKWAADFRDAFRATGKALSETYLSMTSPGDRTLQQVYGEEWEELKRSKEKHDPNGLFDLVVPRIRSGLS
ncbi:hypothetical protein BJY01DRAFT_263244 [Aspergillus pseudoustus]|uniref:FAD-binding PCMH-type domain-containing protein n=1 Tax=Aspergillus pseudoustus TaxID=1810923 RepID=A0ABR4K2Z5_9EURO